jgi:glycosyltransferase involved in cell wall biosynthesis
MSNDYSVRVLQVIDTLGMGGAETWLMEVLRLWSKNRTAGMDFLITSGRPGVFDDEAMRLGSHIHYIAYRRGRLLQFAKSFRNVLHQWRYHAIHDHQDFASGWHFLLGSNALPQVRVTHVHNPAYQIRNNYGVSLGRRLTMRAGGMLVARYSTHITGTSRQIISEYGFDQSRFRRIPKAALYCGFDTTRFTGDRGVAKAEMCHEFGWRSDAKIILFAGRIDNSAEFRHPQNHKNSAFAVSVGMECARRDPRVCMLLAGAMSPAVPILLKRIVDMGFAQRIQFAGIRNDIERLMLASDVLLFPSRAEGLGMVAVEAQAAGLPVLASDAVPRESVVVPELVRFQKVEAGEAAWASELLELAAQNHTVEGANQKVAASAFEIGNSAGALLELYSKGALD